MGVDYDLVIVGGTVQGRRAAALAAREGARVALVEPPRRIDHGLDGQVGIELLTQVTGTGLDLGDLETLQTTFRSEGWANLRRRAALATELDLAPLSPAVLATMGVDVIAASGQFSPKPRLVFTTADRPLRARGYLLCLPIQSTVPAIPGLARTPYRTVDDLLTWDHLPDSTVILGRRPQAIALAQCLARLGCSVTLVSRGERLLPTEDEDLSLFGEQLLRAAGVDLRLGQRPTAIRYNGEFRVELEGGSVIRRQTLILGTAPRPDMAGINLSSLGIQSSPHGLTVDEQLRTVHPRVFACGPALGGYWATATDDQDVPIAVRNALYWPYRKLLTLQRACLLPTAPAFGRVGLSASQAQQWFGSEATMIQVYLGNTLATHLAGDVTGLCRWVVHRDGRLLGAQIWGVCARDLIQTVAGMMQNNRRIQHWERLSSLPHSHAEILEQAVAAWQRQRWQPGTWRRDWAENWFNWRRSRFD
jgi:pyruvate/2-oxoglutarate dehydrogenase complex dihydrolipoamide dehydrogenase (E3) component